MSVPKRACIMLLDICRATCDCFCAAIGKFCLFWSTIFASFCACVRYTLVTMCVSLTHLLAGKLLWWLLLFALSSLMGLAWFREWYYYYRNQAFGNALNYVYDNTVANVQIINVSQYLRNP